MSSAPDDSREGAPPNAAASSLGRRAFLEAGGAAAAAALLAPLATPPPPPSASGVERALAEGALAAPPCYTGDQSKRRGLDAMVKVADGNAAEAIACLQGHLERYAGVPPFRYAEFIEGEFLYGLAAAHAQQGELEEAFGYAEQALDAGLPASRFQAGSRGLLAPLREHPPFRERLREAPPLVHGPLLGAVTDRRAQVWVRTDEERAVQVTARPAREPDAEGGGDPQQRAEAAAPASVRTEAGRDYTGVATLSGLEPGTAYEYELAFDGEEHPETWTFRTLPPEGEPGRFEVGFGGCAGYTPWHERMWDRIAGYAFPLFFLTGDNVYIDAPERPGVQRYCYYRRQSHPAFRRFTAGSAVGAIWDDHDFGTDDGGGGPLPHEPEWKVDVWRTFKNNWNNPAYGSGGDRPGCWFAYRIGDVDFFLLDDRYYRTEPQNVEGTPTMLGPAQKAWLFDRLRASEATFKLIVTSVPWAYGTKPGSDDPWQGYKAEREEIFSFLSEHRVEGVILLSGDRHRADVWKIEREGGAYPLYDLENGRLTNVHTHQKLPGALKSYNEKCTFGRLRFDTARADPEVRYECVTIDGEVAHDLRLRRSQLSHG